MEGGKSDSLRYERKFLITDFSYKEVEQLIRFHPACFSEIFAPRQVNNIYFDTPGLEYYFDNVEGARDRQKVRIRWYGNTFGLQSSPVLEYKIKQGLLGKKNSYRLLPFAVDGDFSAETIRSALEAPGIPSNVKAEVLSLQPMLLNSYSRKYFLSADKKFRMTIDHDLMYYRISYQRNLFLNKSVDRVSTVLEMKYEAAHEGEAKEIGTGFPFSMTKNSKYLQGLERIFI